MKRIRIRTELDADDAYNLNVNLEQNFDLLEILSLKLTQSDVYNAFTARYGVLVGRVIANGGFGVPNAKVSVFIPLDNNETNPDIRGLYPYRSVSDLNNEGIQYNLLENKPQKKCHKAVGTFPSKREILDNGTVREVYDKYYKFTTSTNESGDYMITGVPTGNQIIHMDVDLSDIGFLSQKPYDFIAQGANPNLFESYTTFKSSTDLNSLAQVQTQNASANIIPLWGNKSNGENTVGITRLDFKLEKNIQTTSLFFGSIFTEDDRGFTNLGCRPRRKQGKNCELKTGVGSIEAIRRIATNSSEIEFIPIAQDEQIDENGNWAVALPLNLNPVVTDEFGNLVPSEDSSKGIFTSAQYRFRMGIDDTIGGFNTRSAYYLVPNMYNRFEFDNTTNDADFFEMKWRKVYTVSNYIPRYQKNERDETRFFSGIKNIGECEQTTSFPYNRIDDNLNPLFTIICAILTIVSVIITFINNLVEAVLFDVIQRFICLVTHPFNSGLRSACRCRSCRDLYQGVGDLPPNSYPPDWDGSIDNFPPFSEDDRITCSNCYEAGVDTGSTTCTNPSDYPSMCQGLCQSCEFSLVQLTCNGDTFTDADEWKDCLVQQLAEDLNVITYEFYNDWVIGSLYSFLFKYRVRFRRNGKTLERFCDFDCYERGTAPSDDEHRKNICRTAYIKPKDEFGWNSGNAFPIVTVSNPDSLGLIKEQDNFLYYAARWDGLTTELTPSEKQKLLFATNIVELGSQVNCDLDGKPYIIDKLVSTSYQDSDGVQVLFNASNCSGNVNGINTKGISLISQIGVELLVEEQEEITTSIFEGVDGELYTAYNNSTNLPINIDVTQNPDYSGEFGNIIFDRDTILRKYLCENFPFYSTVGVYSSTNHPTGTYELRDEDGDVVESTTDICTGLDNFAQVGARIHPYYFYFGIVKGNSALDKLKKKYFDGCVE